MDLFLNTMLPSAIAIAIVFLFGCTGETLMEKAGHLNLGLPGIMCIGTFGGAFGISMYLSFFEEAADASWALLILITLLSSAVFSALGGLIYAFLTVTLKCNQNVTGLALTTFGAGFSEYFMKVIDRSKFAAASKIFAYHLPFADSMGTIGNIFFGYGVLVYFAIVVALITAIVLRKTKVGLSLRAVGENPGTADAAGINITKYKYFAILIGSAIAGWGGIYYIMNYVGGAWDNSSAVQALGWLALALVIFTIWKPDLAILGSIVFGLLFILPSYLNVGFLMKKALNMLPYVVTVVVLIVTSIIGKKGVQPPAALGNPYFREER